MGKNTNKQFDFVVIGAGASGMMAAITAARLGRRVCILEKLDIAGKKLLATGNGKCNFTNETMNIDCFHGDKAFIDSVLKRFSVSDCLDFFHSIGIYPKNKNGYFYPNSEQASSIVNALLYELERLQVKVFYEVNIKEISISDAEIVIHTESGNFISKKLIIATGLLAAPKLGSDGSLFDIIKSFGHRFKPVLPALCGYYCKGLKFKSVSGVRAHGTVSAYIDGAKQAEDTGEIQFTDYGLSGIPVFQISRFLSVGLHEKKNVEIRMNLMPELDKMQILAELKHRYSLNANMPAETLLNGFMNQKLAGMILDKAGIDRDVYVSSISTAELEKIAQTMQDIRVKVTNYRDFEFAQVCTGGISTEDIIWENLESKCAPNVHFTGEILDVDGICGGYNLHFAWATGFIAGS